MLHASFCRLCIPNLISQTLLTLYMHLDAYIWWRSHVRKLYPESECKWTANAIRFPHINRKLSYYRNVSEMKINAKNFCRATLPFPEFTAEIEIANGNLQKKNVRIYTCILRERYIGIFNFTRKSRACSLRKYCRHEDENSTKVMEWCPCHLLHCIVNSISVFHVHGN